MENLSLILFLKLVLKKKNRAQITDDGGGILSFFLRNMINQKTKFLI